MDEVKKQIKIVEKAIKREEHVISRAEKREVALLKSKLSYKKINRATRILGPGLVTGAADDDPSGIATYSQAGAAYGFGLLWMFPLMYPLLLSVQETCARIGAVTGDGLAAVLKKHYSKKLLYTSVFFVVAANIVNIGADIGAMAAAAKLLVPLSFSLLAIIFALVVIALQIFVPYRQYAKVLKWLAIALFAYPITAFMVGVPWSDVLTATFRPQLKINADMVYLIVGLLGTTISPYLFFWDTSEIVEDEVEAKRIATSSGVGTPKITHRFMKKIKVDNFVGMTLASVTAWFIVVVCASVLFSHGVTNIETAADAAKALEPLVQGFPHSGTLAKLLFSVGIIGIGLLAVPVLAGSSSYAISEAFGWKEGLYRSFKKARGFYGVIIAATLVGLGMNFLELDPIKMLLFAAVFNGLSSIPLLWMIARIGRNESIMGEYKNSTLTNVGIYAAFIVMTVAGVILLWSLVF